MDQAQSPSNLSSGRYKTVVVDTCRLFREGLICILQATYFDVVAAAANIDEALGQMGREDGGSTDLLICSLDPDRPIGPQLDAIGAVRERDACTKVVMLMPSCSAEDLIAAVLCGADGVILKDISGEKLTAALDLVMHGQHVLPLGVALRVFSGHRAAAKSEDHEQSAHARARAGETAGQIAMVAAADVPLARAAMGVAEGSSVFKAADSAGEREPISSDATRNLGLSDREKQILQCLVEGFANKLIARRLEIAEATVKVHIKGLLRKINVSNRTQAAIWALNQSVAARPQTSPALGASEDRAGERRARFEKDAAARSGKSLLPEMIAVFPTSQVGLPPQKHL